MHVHSTYQREIQDLPIQDKQVILLVDTRKFFCYNPDCLHKTFAERHPFAAIKSEKDRPAGQEHYPYFDVVEFLECLKAFEKRKYHCVQEQHLQPA